jgi:hypothetical protein
VLVRVEVVEGNGPGLRVVQAGQVGARVALCELRGLMMPIKQEKSHQ